MRAFRGIPRHGKLIILSLLTSTIASALEEPTLAQLNARIASHASPRLVCTNQRLTSLHQVAADNTRLSTYVTRSQALADLIITSHDLELNKTLFPAAGYLELGLAWKWTGNRRYADAAVEFIKRQTATATLWTVDNGLQMGATLAGAAMAWDLFHDALSATDRAAFITQLRVLVANYQRYYRQEKGSQNWVPTIANNWNPIFNGPYIMLCLAMGADGALVANTATGTVLCRDPRDYLLDAIHHLPDYFATMSPQGVNPEGVGYWMYGMMYGTMALDSLVNATGSDLGLMADAPGVARAAEWAMAMRGPHNHDGIFNDAGDGWWGRSHFPALWFAQRLTMPHLAARNAYDWDASYRSGRTQDSYPAFHALWTPTTAITPTAFPAPLELDMKFDHPTCAMAITRGHRDDPMAQWAYLKAGRISNHQHANQGAFTYAALGVDWAVDLGQDPLVYRGDYFDLTAASFATYYRKQTRSKSCLLIGNAINQDLLFEDAAPTTFTRWGVTSHGMQAVVDLTPAYHQASRVWRGVASVQHRNALLVQDEVQLASPQDVTWGMMTSGVTFTADAAHPNLMTLSKAGKVLKAHLLSPAGAAFSVETTVVPAIPSNQSQNGTSKRLLVKLPQARGSITIAVLLAPQWPDATRIVTTTSITPLQQWANAPRTAQTITFATLPATTYGASSGPLTATASSGLPIAYTSANPAVATITGNLITITGSGSTVITAHQDGNETFAPAPDVAQTLVVERAPLTVRAQDARKITGTANPPWTMTMTGWQGQDTAASAGFSPTITCTATTASPAGTYPITVAGPATLANYIIAYQAGTLTIAPKTAQTLTFAAFPGKTYGDPAWACTATASSGLAVSYTSSNPAVATITGNLVTITGAGTTVITAHQEGNATYSAATAVPNTLLVARAALHVYAQNASKSVGSANPPFLATVLGLRYADTTATVGLATTLACAATADSPAGTYPITAAGPAAIANYDVTYHPGVLTVSPHTIPRLSWPAPAAVTYGTPLSSSILHATATIPGSFVYTPALGTVLDAGADQVLSATFTPTDTATYATATITTRLTVTPRSLRVGVRSVSRMVGTPNPSWTLTYDGFLAGESAADLGVQPVASCAATADSEPGTYAITVDGGAAVNYTISTTPGTLTILAAATPTEPAAPAATTNAAGSGSCGTGAGVMGALVSMTLLRRRRRPALQHR